MSGVTFALSLLAGVLLLAQEAEPQGALDEAAKALESGKPAEAEHKLQSVLEKDPANLPALLLVGAVLDSEQRYRAADEYYHRALTIAPRSAQVLNNVANHYMASGNRSRAREFYLKAVAIDPQHPNANLQLARMSVEDKRGPPALGYLNHLGDSVGSDSVVLELRARALSLSGQCLEA